MNSKLLSARLNKMKFLKQIAENTCLLSHNIVNFLGEYVVQWKQIVNWVWVSGTHNMDALRH